MSNNLFNEYTLTQSQFQIAGAIFSSILIAIGFYGVVKFDNVKKRAWVISFVNSFITMIVGVIYLWNKIPQYPELLSFQLVNPKFYNSLDNFAVLACLWFFLACLFDILFGLVFYRQQLGLLTAYIHHTVFMWIMVTGITGNGIFLTCEPFAPSFVYMLIEELPTFLLALGSIYPEYRTDIGFGITFFLLRLVYHFYHLAFALKNKVPVIIIVLYSMSGLLHINWFYGWVKMMLKPKKTAKKET